MNPSLAVVEPPLASLWTHEAKGYCVWLNGNNGVAIVLRSANEIKPVMCPIVKQAISFSFTSNFSITTPKDDREERDWMIVEIWLWIRLVYPMNVDCEPGCFPDMQPGEILAVSFGPPPEGPPGTRDILSHSGLSIPSNSSAMLHSASS